MKFLHLADLHIGKKLNDYPLYDDQRFVLNQALDLARKEQVDAIVIAGDIYDSSAPSAEAMDFYDWFLNELYKLQKPILMVAGNHDSAERLNVASSILKNSGIHIAAKIEDPIPYEDIQDARFYLLPYFRPSDINHVFGSDCRSFESAMKEVLSHIQLDEKKCNILVTHQSILPLGIKIESSGSETSLDIDQAGNVGGTETIDVNLLGQFDYLALGHIHKAQNVAANARYAGALLKYHIKEANAKRSFTIVEVRGKDITIHEHPLLLKRDLVILEGSLEDILSREGHDQDYVHARLLNEETVDNPFAKLKAKYPYCLGIEYPHINARFEEDEQYEDVDQMDKNDLFARFYSQYGGRDLEEKEKELVRGLFDKEEDA